jgi:hypothetical protein
MRLLVANTDSDWFDYLTELRQDEVNFWQPSGSVSFHALSPGEPLLFKLRSPNRFIVGGRFISHYAALPVSFTWSAFGQKNGAKNEAEMRRRIEKYRSVEPGSASDYAVNCILLENPFFFSREEWFPILDWPKNVQRYKGYTAEQEVGKHLWTEVQMRLQAHALPTMELELVADVPRFGQPQTVMPRLGQGAFRVIVTDVYNRQMCPDQFPCLARARCCPHPTLCGGQRPHPEKRPPFEARCACAFRPRLLDGLAGISGQSESPPQGRIGQRQGVIPIARQDHSAAGESCIQAVN